MKLGSQSKRVYKLDYSEHHFNKNIKLSKMQCFMGDLNFYLLKIYLLGSSLVVQWNSGDTGLIPDLERFYRP